MRFLAPLLVAALAASAAPAQDTSAPRPAKLMTLNEGETALRRQFYGRVRARETVDLAFQVGGQVIEFPASEGQRVAEGELIAQLDLEPFRRNLRQAEVNLEKAERDLERLQQLSGDNVAEVRVRDAQTQYNLAEISLDQAEDQLEEATLEAPFDALVARRMVANYTTVSAGQPVVRLHDMSEMRVDIDIPEVLFRRTGPQADGLDMYASFPGDDERHPLVLREYEAETADVAQTFSLTLAFTEDLGPGVLPGSATTVTVESQASGAEAIVLPETALVFGPDRAPSVMVFEPSEEDADIGTVTRTPIEIEMRESGEIVMTEGPPAGTEIVATGAPLLDDGQTVRRFTGIEG
ncbi:efflux RND transporter periplasmic adaptor subunit [Histidinibacterium aquaticum]|uniref:Efflux RND transporter periplasmic adaptor subunit n=1 Tax=Histidinibacterium aquaticum TaxID=2613962 RepID=A0A5J5GIN9_9RHOB|nr:efflux RND transporter periplasmic adaptor subunit [Histidinibacterium aquaticum]KAA9008025.1 efflux RND transporter periplasmic adaptor subunit [Histidinibacterium aquaticum]